jgi:hypothetical protein
MRNSPFPNRGASGQRPPQSCCIAAGLSHHRASTPYWENINLHPSRNESNGILNAEQELLNFLMVGETFPPEIVQNILERLKAYRFQSVENQVLYECVASLRDHRTQDLLTALPAQLVRAGFPDFDLERFLGIQPTDAERAMELCRQVAPEQSR